MDFIQLNPTDTWQKKKKSVLKLTQSVVVILFNYQAGNSDLGLFQQNQAQSEEKAAF